jgi:hypothetical protein
VQVCLEAACEERTTSQLNKTKVLIKPQQLASSYEKHYTKQWYTPMGPALSLSVLIPTATLKLQCTYEVGTQFFLGRLNSSFPCAFSDHWLRAHEHETMARADRVEGGLFRAARKFVQQPDTGGACLFDRSARLRGASRVSAASEVAAIRADLFATGYQSVFVLDACVRVSRSGLSET